MNRKPTAQTTNLPRGRRGHANHANGFSIGPGADRAGTDLCGLCGSVRDGLFGSGFAVGPGVDRAVPVAAPGGRGSSDPARSASALTSRCRNHQITGLTPWPIATSARWPTGSESVGPGVDRAGFEPTDHRPLCGFKPMTVGSDPYNPGSIRSKMVLDRIEEPNSLFLAKNAKTAKTHRNGPAFLANVAPLREEVFGSNR